MHATLVTVAEYAAIAVSALAAGGITGILKPPGPHAGTYVMHFAAGVVVAVLAVELLPEVQLMRGGIVHVVGGFVLGTLAMLGLMAWSQRAGEAKRSFPLGIVAAAAVDVTIDGLTIGTGFVAAPATGRLLAIGLATELFPLGLSVAGALRGVSRGRSALTVFALAVLPGIAAVLAGAISAALRRGFWS